MNIDLKDFIEGNDELFTLCTYKEAESVLNKFLEWHKAAISVTRCSLKLEEKHKTDFDVWAISKGYAKMEGEYVKEPEVYNYEFLLQLYNEQN